MISTLLLTAAIAAHPLGNFSVNELVELTLRPDRIDAVAVVDLAELPTLQMTPSCDDFASALSLRVNGALARWSVQSRQIEQPDGAAGLKTTRLTCDLTAAAKLESAATIELDNTYLPDRVGWHEITATGNGVTLQTNLPSRSATDHLRTYPSDPLSTPMAVRKTSFSTTPGADAQRSAAAITEDKSLTKRAETWLTNAIRDPTPLVGLLAVLLAIVLGAAHAALPGHGKTVIAVYMAGRKGRRRDALYVGATVTFTHTAGVLILGIGLTAIASLAAEAVLAWLGIVSGTVMLAVGVGMLFSSLRQRRAAAVAAAHAEASAARWIEIARWHDLDHGIGIVRTDQTNGNKPSAPIDLPGNIHATGLAHADGRVRADEPIHMDRRVLAASRVNVDKRVHMDSGINVDRAVDIDRQVGADYMHSSEHGHAHDPEDEPGYGGRDLHQHDHGHGHHHHGHHHHHHGHGHGHEHGHSHGFWGGHRHAHGAEDDHDRESGQGEEHSHGQEHGIELGLRPRHSHGFWRGVGHGHPHGDGRRGGFWRNFWHGHSHEHSHEHGGEPGHGSEHGGEHGHGSEHGRERVQGRASLAALGIAGGLVPSPTALVVLLGAVALGRTWFGIMLIVAYGLGMAGTLTAAGLLLLRLRDRWSWLNRLSIPPAATGSLIIALGIGLAARAALTF